MGANGHAPHRQRPPQDRDTLTHHFHIEGVGGGTIIAGAFDDGKLREVFIKGFGKGGSERVAFLELIAMLTSIALQYGVPLEVLADKVIGVKFDPRGDTDNPEIPKCKSIPDYMFKWLMARYGDQTKFGTGVVEGVRIGPVHTPSCGYSNLVRSGLKPKADDCTCGQRAAQKEFDQAVASDKG